jgi:ribonuclease G
MKGSILALGEKGGRAVAALMVDGRLEELALEVEGFGPGAILRGRVGRPVKGLGGVFVDLPGGASGFLRAPKGLAPGQAVLVQVAGLADGAKALPLTLRLMLKGRYAILTPDAPGLNISRQIRDEETRADLAALATDGMTGAPEGLGLILRSACESAADETIAAEVAELRELAEAILADAKGPPEALLDAPAPADLAWRDWPAPDTVLEGAEALAQSGALDAIARLLGPRVALPDGASMTIEPTTALIAVDVDTGPDTSPAAGLKASIAAARELPRQLRLRGLGGQATVDFAPFPKRERHILDQALAKAFRPEGEAVSLAGWTPLGNYELTRRRDRPALAGWWR